MMNSYCSPKPFAITDIKESEDDKKRGISTSSPEVFGPPTWAYLHSTTFHLPEQLNPIVAQQVRNTLYAIPVMVPCDKCSLHSGNYITANKERIEAAKTGSEFFHITVDLHNFVNDKLGKRRLNYDEAAERWK